MLKNITIRAEAALIKKARLKALAEKKSLNRVVREWFGAYAERGSRGVSLLLSRASRAQR